MLPANASATSRQLFALARALVQRCLRRLYDEVTVSGSVSRGVSDQYSDIELNFWTEQYQPIEVYQRWVESLDGTIAAGRPARHWQDGTCQLEYHIDGVKYDMIWQRWRDLEASLEPLRQMKLPSDPTLPWMLFHAVSLGDAPRFSTYQARVASYPEPLRLALIDQHLHIWRRMMHVPQIFFAEAQIHRRQLHDLRRRQLMSLDSIFTLLFAYNRLWQPDFRWIKEESERMAHKPPHLVDRINVILTTTTMPDATQTMRDLMRDTLLILSAEFDVEDLIVQFRQL